MARQLHKVQPVDQFSYAQLQHSSSVVHRPIRQASPTVYSQILHPTSAAHQQAPPYSMYEPSDRGPSENDTVSEADYTIRLEDLLAILKELESKWQEVGEAFGISEDLLDEMYDDDTYECMKEMLRWYLYNSETTPTWEDVATALEGMGEKGVAEHIRKMNPVDYRITLESLTSLLKGLESRWQEVGKSFGVAEAILNEIYIDKGEADECMKEMLRWFLYHSETTPTWEKIATALERIGERGVAEHIRELHPLNPRDLFMEAMKYGYVEARLNVLLLIGAAGAGKSHAKQLFLGLPPPAIRQSTPLAEEAIRAMSTQRATITGTTDVMWDLVTLEQLKQMIADAIKAARIFGPSFLELLKSQYGQNLSLPTEPEPRSQGYSTAVPLDLHSSDTDESSKAPLVPSLSTSSQQEQDQKILDLIMSSEGSQKLFEVDWMYLVDSGGQPSFHEILPLFIHTATAVAFILKLSEQLSSKPMVEYYGEDGERCGFSYTSPLTNEQILNHCIRSMESRHDLANDGSAPNIFVVGTHRDGEQQCTETRKEKNSKLREILHPIFGNKLAYYRVVKPEEVIFPVNAKTPNEYDHLVAKQFRRSVARVGREIRFKIPLPWFVLEQYLQRLAAEKCRKVLSTGECKQEAHRLQMNGNACEAALKFLDKLNMFFYRPKYLKGVVFCGAQVWLDKITELIELMHRLQGELQSGLVGESEPSCVNEGKSQSCPDEGKPRCDGYPVKPNYATGAQSDSSLVDRSQSDPSPVSSGTSHWLKRLSFQFRSKVRPSSKAQKSAHKDGPPAPPLPQVPADPVPCSEAHTDESQAPRQVKHRAYLPHPDVDLSEVDDNQWLRFREYGIVTVDILKLFPKHYVEEIFTPAKLIALLTAFQVLAPISEGSLEYVMPCLLRELAPKELDKHRQLDPSSPVAPLLIQFPGNWVPAGVFTVLISYLQNVAQWLLCLTSGNPTCFYRNCVEFRLPTGHGGSVTLVDTFQYLEIHVVAATAKTCKKACPQIVRDILSGIREAAHRLNYGILKAKIAFFCQKPTPACSPEPHLANVIDDDWVCSVNQKISGELATQQQMWLGHKQVMCLVTSNSPSPSTTCTDTSSMTKSENASIQVVQAPYTAGSANQSGLEGTLTTDKCKDITDTHHPIANQILNSESTASSTVPNPVVCSTTSETNRPSMIELVSFRGRNRRINLPQEIGIKYHEFGYLLLNDQTGSRVQGIVHHLREDPQQINREILQNWVSGTGLQPVTWETLVQVLRDTDLVNLANEVAEVKLY